MQPATPADTGSPDPANGIPLFLAPRINPKDCAPVRRGTDLYAHQMTGGTVRFSVWEWSLIPGEKDRCRAVSEEFAVFFIQELCCRGECDTGIDHEHLVHYLPVLYGTGT